MDYICKTEQRYFFQMKVMGPEKYKTNYSKAHNYSGLNHRQ